MSKKRWDHKSSSDECGFVVYPDEVGPAPDNATVVKDLLKELEAVRSWMEDCLMDRGEPSLPSRRRYDAVLRAIHKATGGEA
jgi:hypothetical protein